MGPEKEVRAEEVALVSIRKVTVAPTTFRVTRGSSGFVWKGPRDSQDRIKGGRNNFPKEERWSH